MNARERKTKWFLVDPQGFKEQLQEDICQIRRWARKKNKKICIRLNGTSDLDFLDIIRYNADLQFYDYTKSLERYIHVQNDKTLGNYHLTFSRSENNEKEMYEVLQTGGNVAMVFSPTILKVCNGYPDKWEGYKVINGDQTDLRFLDEKNVIIGLKAKGKAKKDPYGFVIKRELPMVTL